MRVIVPLRVPPGNPERLRAAACGNPAILSAPRGRSASTSGACALVRWSGTGGWRSEPLDEPTSGAGATAEASALRPGVLPCSQRAMPPCGGRIASCVLRASADCGDRYHHAAPATRRRQPIPGRSTGRAGEPLGQRPHGTGHAHAHPPAWRFSRSFRTWLMRLIASEQDQRTRRGDGQRRHHAPPPGMSQPTAPTACPLPPPAHAAAALRDRPRRRPASRPCAR